MLPARLLIVLGVVVTFDACNQASQKAVDTSNPAAESRAPTADSPPVSPISRDTTPVQALSCSPTVLRVGDTLTLRMPTPHGRYLIADQPDGTQFYIVYPSLGVPSRKYSFVPSEDFETMSTLRFPADIKANPRVLGRENGVEPLFVQRGTYHLKLGELEGRYYDCKIRYR